MARQNEVQELGTIGNGNEAAAFRAIQDRLGPIYREIFFDGNAPRTVVVVPSLSLDQKVLARQDFWRAPLRRADALFVAVAADRGDLPHE